MSKAWDSLSMSEKSEMMKVAIKNGITNLDEIRKRYNEFAEGGNLYAEGGNTDDDLVDWIIREEGFLANPKDIGDGKITLGSGLTNPKWVNLYKKRGNKWSREDNRRAVTEEVASRRKWAEANIPNWDSLPKNSQKALLSYKYNYDFTKDNSPKLFKALEDSDLQEAARQMDATSRIPAFRKGLEARRRREQKWFLSDVVPVRPPKSYNPAPVDNTYMYNPFAVAVENIQPLPIMVPDTDRYITTHEITPTQDKAEKYYEQAEDRRRFDALMNLLSIPSNPRPQYVPQSNLHFNADGPLIDYAIRANGGHLYDGISEDNQQMDRWSNTGWSPLTLEEISKQAEEAERRRKTLRNEILSKTKADVARRTKDYLATSNDATATTYSNNSHLADRALAGAKSHALWEKEHPNLTAWWNLAGALPIAVATYPLASTLGSGLAALGDVTSATSAGQNVTSALAPVATAATTTLPYVNTSLVSLGNAGLTSAFGAHGLQSIKEGKFTPMTVLDLSPVLQVAKPTVEMADAAIRNAYDNGTFWDAYTTFKGRFGNYGDNIFTNMYGTAARRFGLPDKARIPADTMRKLKGDVHIQEGLVDLTGDKFYRGKPHTNATLDRGVVSHGKGQWEGADTYITPTRNFIGQTKGYLKSIEPSDMFSNGVRVTELPQNTTLISGDVDALKKAREMGIQTLSSPKLRRIYREGLSKYKVEKAKFDKQYNSTSGFLKRLLKEPSNPKHRKWWHEYTTEMQRLQTRRGTPTLEDFRLLEQQTGLRAGVAPFSEYQNAIEQIQTLPLDENGVIKPLIYPNGRVVDISGKAGRDTELELLKRASYNKVFYDPASMVEYNWLQAHGLQ